MQETIRKHAVSKTMLTFTSRFRRHRSALLRAFGEKRSVIETFEYLADSKNILENAGYNVLGIL
jgi:hypothetical protein